MSEIRDDIMSDNWSTLESDNWPETCSEAHLNEVLGELAAQERQIAPPAHLRQRVMEDFVRSHAADRSSKELPSKTRRWPWQWSWSIQNPLLLASCACLIVAALLLVSRDGSGTNGTGSLYGQDSVATVSATAGLPAAEIGHESLTGETAQSTTSREQVREADDEVYTIFSDLADSADSEYLILIDIPADQLWIQESSDDLDIARAAAGSYARLALGDDGTVRAIQITPASGPY